VRLAAAVSTAIARAGWGLCVRIFEPPLIRIASQLIPAHAGRFNMSSELIKHVSDASFETDVLKSSQPVLVDYWAEWCGPCKMIAPVLDELAQTYQGRLQIAKVNVDENRDTPAKYGIRGIPTLMLFRDGSVAATKVGALSKAQLVAFLDANL
jgi:thioredoxin 1